MLMSGNSRSKGLLILLIHDNNQVVRKWNEAHCQRQIRAGQVVLKVTLGQGLITLNDFELGMGIEHPLN